MKARLGMAVENLDGSCEGKVVAMSRGFCIVQDEEGEEWAADWTCVRALVEPPDAPASTLQEGPELEFRHPGQHGRTTGLGAWVSWERTSKP